MALDNSFFRNNAKAFVRQQAIKSVRGSDSDHIEAKANITVDRILSEGRSATESPQLDTAELELVINHSVQPVTLADEIAADSMKEYDDYYEEHMADEAYEKYPMRDKEFILPPAESSGLVTTDFALDESQVAAMEMLIHKQYGCLIGAAGSGKTTVQRFFLHKIIYGDEEFGVDGMEVKKLGGKQGLNIALCAFTGIATQVIKSNMPSWLHGACKTIHSLLEYAPVTTDVIRDGQMKQSTIFMPSRHAGNKLDHNVILIDEASMVGLDLWHQLLDACRPGTKIFLIGDLNQLPPTASQSMFAYALSDWPVAELTHIHRQKEAAANKIIEVAHAVLNGKEFDFDDASTNHNWRVIGYQLDPLPVKAGNQIVSIANALRSRRVHSSVDPNKSLVYDPYRDRIITAGNGYDESDTRAAVQQSIINDALSQLIVPTKGDHPRFIIDAGLSKKKFAVDYRVMATKNEPPDVEDRVTNGMVGQITSIEKNNQWSGNHALVGPEEEVTLARKAQVEAVFANQGKTTHDRLNDISSQLDVSNFDFTTLSEQKTDREGGGPASHKVQVRFVNGAVRTFSTKNAVDSLMLAYASTCHKCQGSQFDTAIIVVHHAVKGQLSREWLYTAVTRAAKRVVFLYTTHGIKCCLAKQRIFGRTLKEKIERYRVLNEEGVGPLKTKIRLSIEGRR